MTVDASDSEQIKRNWSYPLLYPNNWSVSGGKEGRSPRLTPSRPRMETTTERLKLTLMTVAKYQPVESLDAQSHPS